MGLSLHGTVSYTAVALILTGVAVAAAPRSPANWRRTGRRAALVGALAMLPAVTTGLLAHCQIVWARADVQETPPNLPWYRLAREADRAHPRGGRTTIPLHAWPAAAAAGTAAALALLRRDAVHRFRGKRLAVALAAVALTAAFVITTGVTLRDAGPAAEPTWPTRAQLLLTGVLLALGIVVIDRSRRPAADPKHSKIAAAVTIGVLFLLIGLTLWIATAWQRARLAAFLRQPRDAADLLTSIAAIIVLDLILWARAKESRRRWTAALPILLALLLAAKLWLTVLILYDGTYRGSPLWRFHRPFVQIPH